MSSKGQVVIPEAVRKQLGLEPGDHFVVAAEGDVIVLKVITRPSMVEFETLIERARDQAKRPGMKRSDINKAMQEARRSR